MSFLYNFLVKRRGLLAGKAQRLSTTLSLLLGISVILNEVIGKVSAEMGQCADGTERYPGVNCTFRSPNSCPNTYRCTKMRECCRYKRFRDCDAIMSDTSDAPHPCQGDGAITCPDTHKCYRAKGDFYSMCCPKNVTCIDEVGIEHKPTDKSWKSNYDKCNMCECWKNGTITCTNKPKCSKCRVGGKDISQGDFYTVAKKCQKCKCISKKRSKCVGPCVGDAMGTPSGYTTKITDNGGCIRQARVSICYNKCADKVVTKTEFKQSQDHTGACKNPGAAITEGGFIITRGEEVRPKYNYKWMVFLRTPDDRICGGSILSPRHILTAAHCIFISQDTKHRAIEVFTGKHNVKVVEPFQQYRTVNTSNMNSVHVHEGFNLSTYKNDIAVLVVDPPIDLNNVTQPIRLAESHFQTMDITDKNCKIIGWGKYNATTGSKLLFAKNSDVLLEAKLTNLTCDLHDSEHHTRVEKYTDIMFCASNFRGKRKISEDSCFGDSGGPLMCRLEDKLWTQYGIVSWGSPYRCGFDSGVYTKVANYTDWINDKITYNGNWSDFGSFTPCSTTCGPGKKSRVRICSNPEPIRLGTCVGELGTKNKDKKTGHITDVETVDCQNAPCP